MKSMKHLLRLVGAFALTSTAATSVVACGEQEKTDKEYSDAIVKQLQSGVDGSTLTTASTQSDALKLFQAAAKEIKDSATVALVTPGDAKKLLAKDNNTIQVIVTVGTQPVQTVGAIIKGVTQATNAQYVAAIKAKLQSGVDGSTLTTASTQADAVNLFKAAATNIKDSATVALVTAGDALKVLVEGNNTIAVTVTVGSESGTVNAVVKGVTKTDAECVAAIKTALENGVDGSTLTTVSTQADAVRLFQAVATKVKSSATVVLVTPVESKELLVAGNNTIAVKVTVGSEHDTVSAVLTGVTVATDAQCVAAIKTALENGVDGSTLTAASTQSDAVRLFQSVAEHRISKSGVTVVLVIPAESTKLLVAGNNTIQVTVTVGSESDTVGALLTGVPAATDAQWVAAISKALENGVDGSTLTTANTRADAVNLFQAAATKIKDGATVALGRGDVGTRKLVEGTNTIQVTITVGAQPNTVDAVLTGVTVATDAQCVAAIKTALQNGVDGSTLDISKAQADAVNLFQAAATNIKDSATVALVTPGDETKRLVAGNNTIQVTVTVGSESDTVGALLTGVTVTDSQYVEHIKRTLETTGVDGSTLNTANTQGDAQSLIQTACDNIVSGATFTFVSGDTPLTAGENIVNIKLAFNTLHNTAIAVKLTNVSQQ